MNTTEILKPIKTLISKLTLVATVNFVLFLGGVVCIALGCIALNTVNPDSIARATTGLGSGLVLMLAATIERFESLKGLGLEAKTRDLKLTIEEANQTLTQLRQLAEISGRTLSSLVAKFGRGEPAFTVKENYELAQELRKTLTELKSDKNSIVRVLQPWVQGLCSELAMRIMIDFANDYRSVEQSVAEQISKIPYKHDTPNPERDELIKFRESIETHGYRGYESNKWPAQDVLANLRKHVSTAPGADESLIAKHLALIESWAEEVNYLLEFSNLKSPQRWDDTFVR